MTQPTITSVQDRFYQIFSAVGGGLKAARTFPANTDSAKLPLVFSLPGRVTERSQSGQFADVTRTYEIILVVGDWNNGIPVKTAQELAEAYIEIIEDTLIARPRLELTSVALNLTHDALDGVISATLGPDSGLVPILPEGGKALAGVRFPVLVKTRKMFTFEISLP